MKIKEAAVNVLREMRQPLTAKEVTGRILSAGLWKTAGKTPARMGYWMRRMNVRHGSPGVSGTDTAATAMSSEPP
jgi:hypothetical protein